VVIPEVEHVEEVEEAEAEEEFINLL